MHVQSDIPGTLKPSRSIIWGFGGATTTNIWVGTISWSWDNNTGTKHKMIIPNSFYVPEGKCCLLSTQHWAQGRNARDRLPQVKKSSCSGKTNVSPEQYRLTYVVTTLPPLGCHPDFQNSMPIAQPHGCRQGITIWSC